MENSLSDELFCSLKNELREVDAQISVHSKKLLELIDQKKELSSNWFGKKNKWRPLLDVISPKNGKALSIETLVSYEKKERAGEFSDYSEGKFE